MTSRNLFFKLLKEDLKRRAWAIALMFVTMFFSFPVAISMYLGEKDHGTRTAAEIAARNLSGTLDFIGISAPLTVMILMTAALILGITSFSYLHNKRRVDFYHSLPIPREMLFQVQYAGGIFIAAAVYLVNLGMALVVAGINHVDMAQLLPAAVNGYLIHMLFFILMYSVTVLSMVMTGNIIVGILGTAVFNFYVPGVTALLIGCYGMFFKQFYIEGFPWTSKVSPVILYVYMAGEYDRIIENGDLTKYVVCVLLAIIVLVAVSMVLYWKRPSEAAGKAMAFPKSRPVVKVLLVTAFGLAGTVFFNALRNSLGWGIFGGIVGTVLSHCIIEIIYHMDFKKLFSNKVCLGGCTAAVLMVFFGFYFDITGYDTYVPKAEKVESAYITTSIDESWLYDSYNYYGIDETGKAVHEYGSSEDYAKKHMTLTDIDTVIKLAEAGIEYSEKYSSLPYEERAAMGYDNYMRTVVFYRMKSGKVVRRAYQVPVAMAKEALNTLLSDTAYLMGSYPILSMEAEKVEAVQYIEMNQITNLEESSQWKQQLLLAYQQDFTELTLETREKELPVASLQIITGDELDYINQKTTEGRQISSNDICVSYPVYPSFERTISLLREAGIEAGNAFDYSKVKQVNVYYYQVGEDGTSYQQEYVFTDLEDIQEIRKSFMAYMYMNRNELYQYEKAAENYSAEFIIKDGIRTETLDGQLLAIPDCVKAVKAE